MDTFAEQLVKKSQNSSDSMKKIIILVCGGVIVALLLFLTIIFPFTFIFAAGAAYGTYLLLTGLNIEYEYTVTNAILDIDKIISKRKRVSMISVDVKDFTSFGIYTEDIEDFNGTIVMTTGGEEELYFAEFSDESNGSVRLIFSPSEKILCCIKPHLPRNLNINKGV